MKAQRHLPLQKRPPCLRDSVACVVGGLVAATPAPLRMTYNCAVEFRLDRRAFVVTTTTEDARRNRSLAYWRGRPPEERLAAVEFLRRQFIGPGARLQRVLRVTTRPPR